MAAVRPSRRCHSQQLTDKVLLALLDAVTPLGMPVALLEVS